MVAPAVIGAVAPFILSSLFGKKERQPKTTAFSQQTSQQQDLIDQILAAARGEGAPGAVGELFGPLDIEGLTQQFQQGFAEPQMRQFLQRTAPQIREQFITAGAGRSSGANEEIQRSGEDVQQNLNEALARMLFGAKEQQQSRQLDILSRILATPGQQNVVIPGAPSTTQALLEATLGGAAPAYGEALGQGVTSLFNRQGGGTAPRHQADFPGYNPVQAGRLPTFTTSLRRGY